MSAQPSSPHVRPLNGYGSALEIDLPDGTTITVRATTNDYGHGDLGPGLYWMVNPTPKKPPAAKKATKKPTRAK